MPDPTTPLLDELIAQQTARQGHPLATVPANAPLGSAAAAHLQLLQQIFGPNSADKWEEGSRMLRAGKLPSQVVGKLNGSRNEDIELPSQAPVNALKKLIP